MLVFDSCALVKVLIDEEGSAEARSLWAVPEPRYASALAYVEACSALARARTLRRISGPTMKHAFSKLDVLWGGLGVAEVTAELSLAAGPLAAATGLKGADAVHLATAMELGPSASVLVTWDKTLARVAQELGLLVAP
jgi:predicted nucleic acid-binding protein